MALFRKLIKINGDDGLVGIPEIFKSDYLSWMDNLWNINRVKTQISDNMFTLNSRMFRANKGRALEVPFYRLNLFERIDRGGNFLINPQVWNEILEGMNGSHRYIAEHGRMISEKRAWKHFHKNWCGTLQYLTKEEGGNYFLPEIVGGLGLTAPSSLHFWTTPTQDNAINIVKRTLNKESVPPKFRTRVVPVTKPLGGIEQKITVQLPSGVTDYPSSRPEFSGTARVKAITTNTKLFTSKLPRVGKKRVEPRPSLNEISKWSYGNIHSDQRPTFVSRWYEASLTALGQSH